MKYVIYKRLSKESKSGGLGLDAQQAAVDTFLRGKDYKVISTYEEIETGTSKGNKRPALAQALKDCKDNKATLLIARIDRLARNVYFISGLMESGVNFIAVDNPYMTKFNAQILACVAELEAEMISTRTKAALQALKARGKSLGTPSNLTQEAKAKGLQVMNTEKTKKSKEFATSLAPLLLQCKSKNMSLSDISRAFNEQLVPSAAGKVGNWQVNKVQRVLKSLELN